MEGANRARIRCRQAGWLEQKGQLYGDAAGHAGSGFFVRAEPGRRRNPPPTPPRKGPRLGGRGSKTYVLVQFSCQSWHSEGRWNHCESKNHTPLPDVKCAGSCTKSDLACGHRASYCFSVSGLWFGEPASLAISANCRCASSTSAGLLANCRYCFMWVSASA